MLTFVLSKVGTTFSFEMEMKPRVKDAILLSIAAPGLKGDYLTLQMLDGNVKVIVVTYFLERFHELLRK